MWYVLSLEQISFRPPGKVLRASLKRKVSSIKDAGLGCAIKEFSHPEITKETPGGDRVEKIATGRTEENLGFWEEVLQLKLKKHRSRKSY